MLVTKVSVDHKIEKGSFGSKIMFNLARKELFKLYFFLDQFYFPNNSGKMRLILFPQFCSLNDHYGLKVLVTSTI